MMKRLLLLLLTLPLLAGAGLVHIEESPRHYRALLIGNADYTARPLQNPVRDVRLLAPTLEKLGFQVSTLENADQKQMLEALRQFSKSLDPDSLALFYFAGHGLPMNGQNYLLPVDSLRDGEAPRPEQIADRAVSIHYVLGALNEAGYRLLFIDGGSSTSSPLGFTVPTWSNRTWVALANSPGRDVQDGAGENSPFAAALNEVLQNAPSLQQLQPDLIRAVDRATHGQQIPRISSNLCQDLPLTAPGAAR